jgi:hypothetical protein
MSAVHIIKILDDLYTVDSLKIKTINGHIIKSDEARLNDNQLNALNDFIKKCNEGVKINSTITH